MEMMIYALLSVKRDFGLLDSLLISMKGITGAELYAVTYDEIAAVVSDIHKSDLITDNTNVLNFAGVIDQLAQHFTLLPMRFGSVLESAIPVITMLERNYQDIQQNLQKVKDKHEFGLKIFCDAEKLASELKNNQNNQIIKLSNPDPQTPNSVYREWVDKKLLEHRLEESRNHYVDSVISEITSDLLLIHAVSKFRKIPSATNILDALFLVEKDKKNELISVIEELQNKYPGLNFILTGPWPPYNFVETTIK